MVEEGNNRKVVGVEEARSQMCCRGRGQHWHPQYQLEEDTSLAPKLNCGSGFGDSHGQHGDISCTRAKMSGPCRRRWPGPLQIGQTCGWRQYHIRTSKPVMRPDEGMSFSCFARVILTARDPVKELWETTRRSPQKDSGGTHFWWRQEPPLEGYPHIPGGIAAPRRSHGWSVHKTVATLQHTVGCRTAGRRTSHGWCTGTAPSGAYCGRQTPSDEGGHRQHQRPDGHQRYGRLCSNKLLEHEIAWAIPSLSPAGGETKVDGYGDRTRRFGGNMAEQKG